MGKKTEMDIERAKQKMAVAHEKKLQAINRVFDRVRGAEVAAYARKMRMLDQAAQKIAAADPGGKVAAATSMAAETISSVAEVAGETRAKTSRQLRRQPWIMPVAASVLFLALGVSVGRRYFSPG